MILYLFFYGVHTQCLLSNLKEVPIKDTQIPTLSKHLNCSESQKTQTRKKPKPENITEEIREKEAEKIVFKHNYLYVIEYIFFLFSTFVGLQNYKQ